MECPIGDDPTCRVFQKNGFWIRECQECHHRFVEFTPSYEHVTKVYGDDYFEEGGAGYSDYISEAEIIISHGRKYGKLLNKYIKPGRVLDVGAAAGFILMGLLEQGWDGIGLEPNATMAEYGRVKGKVEIIVGTLEKFESKNLYDLVTMVQVVPHFYHLRQALSVAADLTKPNGYWFIETWNKDSFLARFMGQNWHEYSPPSVLHFFSPETLRLLVEQYGFEEIARGRPVKKISGGHVKSLLDYMLKSSILGKPSVKMLNLIPNGIIIPYPSFDLFWTLFQKK
jgi:2-polyprenyl-3-methyl-5-hydroxy-6-metoxy-1,4-benzoquinol methylase